MKKSILVICLMAAMCGLQVNNVQAQKGKASSAGGGDAASVGNNVLNLGVGFLGGYSYAGYNGVTATPALSAYYEKIYKQLGPGKLGLGGGLEYKSVSYNYSFGGYKATWSYLILAFRATYHPDFLKTENLDTYGGIALGYSTVTYKDTYYDQYAGGYAYSYPSAFYPSFFVGARFYFTPKFGAFAEVGSGITYMKIGLNLKF